MISKEEFLEEVKRKIFPLIDLKKEKKIKTLAVVVAFLAFLVSIPLTIAIYKSSNDKDLRDFLLLFLAPSIAYTAIWGGYVRRTKKKLRPLVLGILKAVHIPENQLFGPSIKQLRKLHFLPRFDSRLEDKITQDSFGIENEEVPFYIQEVSFSEGGKHPAHFDGPLIRLSLAQQSNLKLMVIKKDSLLYKDKIALSTKKSMDTLLGSADWQPLTLESTEFNDKYFAFTNDQILARSKLTPRFMEHISDVEKVYKAPTNFLFYESQLILIIKTNRNMFEFFEGGQQISFYEQFYDEINVLHQFEDVFKLK